MFKKDLLECLDYIETQDISKVKKAIKKLNYEEGDDRKPLDIIKEQVEHTHIKVIEGGKKV